MQSYEKILNSCEGKKPISIQGIYDMIYAQEITPITVSDFCRNIHELDTGIADNSTRTLVMFYETGKTYLTCIPLQQLDPQLREVMVICGRLIHHSRDNHQGNDYRHVGLEDYKGRLYMENSLCLPNGKKAGDLAELGVAIREKLALYYKTEDNQ